MKFVISVDSSSRSEICCVTIAAVAIVVISKIVKMLPELKSRQIITFAV